MWQPTGREAANRAGALFNVNESRTKIFKVISGGCILAFTAAAVNVSFLMKLGASVSHLTGDLSRFSSEIIDSRQHPDAWRSLSAALLGFASGAMGTGYLLRPAQLEFSKPYGRAISVVGLFWIMAYYLLGVQTFFAVLCAATGCGIQNALASHYHGMILRTTHITGLMTDFGVALGMKLHGREVEYWKITTPLFLMLSYFMGALCGTLSFLAIGERTILVAGSIYLGAGLIYVILRQMYLKRHF